MRDKQIEEMASVIHNTASYNTLYERDSNWLAQDLYTAGYRKSTEVATEIFKELIDNATFIEYADGGRYLRFNAKFFAELKKKYEEKVK